MIDPDVFQERAVSGHRLVSWLYDHGFLQLHHGELRLTDKAAFYAMTVIAFASWALVV